MAPAALVVALAALVAGGAALVQVRAHESAGVSSAASTAAAGGAETEAANRALCTAIAPLMADDARRSNAFVDAGPQGTPERDAAIPGFSAGVEDWAGQIQEVVDAHAQADPFLRRTLQRFVDDRVLLSRNIRPGPPKAHTDQIWSDSLSALGGPLSVCGRLGVSW